MKSKRPISPKAGSLHSVVTRRLVKMLRSEEKRYAEMALKSDASSPSNEWFKGWAQGTSNTMGWLADKLNASRRNRAQGNQRRAESTQ